MRHALPNVLLPAVLVLLAIIANPALASGRKPVGDTLLPPALRDSFPDAVSYPLVRWLSVDSLSSDSLTRSFAAVFPEDEWPYAQHRWWVTSAQSVLQSPVPNSRTVYLAMTSAAVNGGRYTQLFIEHSGRLYRDDELNDLAASAGFSFDADSTSWLATLAASTMIARAYGPPVGPRHTLAQPNPPISPVMPSVSVLRAARSENGSWAFDCLIGSRRGRIQVSFNTLADNRSAVGTVEGLGARFSVMSPKALPEPGAGRGK